MSYLRGEDYIWDDSEGGFHFWCKNGYDGWDESGWACSEEKEGERHDGYERASGVRVRRDVIDAFVMMRLARLIYEGKIEEAVERASNELGGNVGGAMLRKNAARISEALSGIKLEDAQPYIWKRDEDGKIIFD